MGFQGMSVRSLIRGVAGLVLLTLAQVSFAAPVAAAGPAAVTQIRITIDENPLVPHLAASLGYLAEERIELVPVDINSLSKSDFLLQQPLIDGRIDASYHWFHHAVFGARHNLPIRAVMMFNDAPGMSVLVANRLREQIRGAADFKGRRVAEGAGYGTKSLVTGFLATRAGLPARSYTPVMMGTAGRQEAVLAGLSAGEVDVMTFQEPMSSILLATGQASKLYDLNRKESTIAAFGAAWPAQSLLMAPSFIDRNPDAVQRLVNAFVKTLRFMSSHSAQEIAARLPPDYFKGKDRSAETALIASTLSTYARDDYGFAAQDVRLVVDAIQSSSFDDSESGRWRATAENPKLDQRSLYDNRFVERAMKAFPVAKDDSYEARVVAPLPRYVPGASVSGVISIWGHGRRDLPWMMPLIAAWIEGLQKFHPGISLDYRMYGTSSGVPALFTGIGDIAILGEEILPEAAAAFERAKGYAPLGIEIATGSVDVRNFDYAQQFFVHADNPLERATLSQLDGVFGAEHRRGQGNLRRWGQLGLTGEWVDAPITPYGWKLDDSFAFYIQEAVLAGSHRWNCDLREFAHINQPDGTIYDHGQQILDALTKDRRGIAVSNIRYSNAALKSLALATEAGGPYYQATKQTLVERQYPLTRTIPAIINREPGKPVDPKVREFLRFVLSRDGQEAINRDGRYLPLAPWFIEEQLKKLQ